MPRADDFLREQMNKRFGDPIAETGPIEFLEKAGYTLVKSWVWQPKPGVTSLKEMTRDEFDCLLFLVREWDFGGLMIEENSHGETS